MQAFGLVLSGVVVFLPTGRRHYKGGWFFGGLGCLGVIRVEISTANSVIRWVTQETTGEGWFVGAGVVMSKGFVGFAGESGARVRHRQL